MVCVCIAHIATEFSSYKKCVCVYEANLTTCVRGGVESWGTVDYWFVKCYSNMLTVYYSSDALYAELQYKLPTFHEGNGSSYTGAL